jgi:hypothetical protein
MSNSKCPECGERSAGNFCQSCGASLGGRFCNQCGAALAEGAKFCNQCGEGVAGGGRSRGGRTSAAHREAAVSVVGGQNLPWWIAGVAMFALIVFLGVRMVSPAGNAAPAGQPQPVAPFAGGGGTGTPPDLSQMTPRQAADRLFDRVMTYVSASDSGQAQAFLPMALGAYERAQPLDHDGMFHLSLLNRVAGNFEEALANAQQVLADDPNHVLALMAAAEASAELGRMEEAADFYRHILDVLDAEVARALPEYEAHQVLMQSVRNDAEAFLAGR